MNRLIVENLGKCYRLGKKGSSLDALQWLARPARWVGINIPKKQPRRELWALKNVSFALERGTILGIIGPNGAGKTTLLKIIGRVSPPTEGRIRGSGRVVSLLEIGAGFLPDLSGRENVFLNAAMYGIPRPDVVKRFNDIVEFAQLEEFIDVPLKRYSSGMYLRLAFSVAINMDPDILLADEVLAVGDLEFQERCLQRVEEVGQEGVAVLFVSHDMDAILRLCDRVILLNAGQIVQDGSPEEVVTEYQSAAWLLVGDKLKPGEKGSHVNKYGEILSVRLVSKQGSEIGAVRISEDMFVKITFSITQSHINVRCAIDTYTRGVHAFRSVQPSEFFVAEEGVYNALVGIPKHLLSETIYTATAGITLSREDKEQLPPLIASNVLTFQVYDTNESISARGSFKGRLKGVVTPRLEWNLVKERELARA